MVQRALRSAIVQMAPVRRILANNYRGGPLDCVGGNPNDLTADSKGGAYFSQGAVYYAAPKRHHHAVRREHSTQRGHFERR